VDASPAASPAPSRWRRVVGGFERLAVAHLASYPLAFLWAAAAIPLTIHLRIHDIDALGGDMDRIGHFVVGKLAWPAGTAFTTAHALGLPWALARDTRRWQRWCLVGLGLEAALGIAFGAVSWAWLMLR
jgi:hypothetical protein